MASESIYQFGEVVLEPFPFSNQAASKKRPAVVISSVAYHVNCVDLLIMAIISQARTTLEQMLVIRRMGHLSLGDQHSLRQMLTQILG